ncbi:MAG: hypothetical protein VYB54_07495 [Pseudomonadota bacterium]|nr:hypothetical protein [Pseudomonadota bacterium]
MSRGATPVIRHVKVFHIDSFLPVRRPPVDERRRRDARGVKAAANNVCCHSVMAAVTERRQILDSFVAEDLGIPAVMDLQMFPAVATAAAVIVSFERVRAQAPPARRREVVPVLGEPPFHASPVSAKAMRQNPEDLGERVTSMWISATVAQLRMIVVSSRHERMSSMIRRS